MHTARKIFDNLDNALGLVVKNKEKYVTNPQKDFTRNRKLPIKDVLNYILAMEGGSLKKELYHFSSFKKTDITPSAFVQQRSKISFKAFEDMFHYFNVSCKDTRTYHGYKLYAVDGSDVNHFRNPDSECFVNSSSDPKGYNQTHLNAIYDLCDKTYVDIFLQARKRMDERGALITMLKRNNFSKKSIIITDRGYESYNMFAHLMYSFGGKFLCRVKQDKGALKEIAKLPMMELDTDIITDITTTQTNDDKANGRIFIQTGSKKGKVNSSKTYISKWDFASPFKLKFRVVRFSLKPGEYETIVTSLSRNEFTAQEIKKLYHMRWGVETSFKELKYATGLINLHCKKDELVKQEIYATIIMYNFCSRVAGSATICKRKNTKYAYKVDFTMAVHLCRLFYKNFKANFQKLVDDIGKYSEPIRPGRSDKRNLKPKSFIGFTYRVAA